MPGWAGSTRRGRLPPEWAATTKRILERDEYRCRIRDRNRCLGTATQVDHIVAGDNHDDTNLQAACAPCHASKSGREGRAARVSTQRPREPHPGAR